VLRSPATRPRVAAPALPGVPPFVGATLPALGALVLWALTLPAVELGDIAGLGMLSALPPTYVLALLLLGAGFAWQVSRPVVDARALAAYVVASVVVIHATTPLLYDAPRYAWVYKHFGVIDWISVHDSVDRSVDLYHNWPAFFAVNAWLSEATGVAPIEYAEWAQLFFGLANVAAVVFAVRGVTTDARVVWTTAWIFVFANWVGQDYLAPQALGFVLSVVVIGLCLRATRVGSRPATRAGAWLLERRMRLQERVGGGRPVPRARPFDPPVAPTAARVLGGLVFLAVVMTHQLSPLMVVGAVIALLVAGQRVPPWILLAMLLVEAWWVALAWPELAERFDVFAPDPTATPSPPGNPAWAEPGQRLVRLAQVGLLALLAALAAVGAAQRLRRGRWDARPLALAVAPVLVGLAQTYGGESMLRAFLFGLPWLSLLAAEVLVGPPAEQARRAVRATRVLGASAAIAACFLVAYFGRELENVMTADDVAAASWIATRPGDPSYAIASGNAPSRITAQYPRRNPAFIVSDDPELWPRDAPRPRLRLLARRLRALPGEGAFLTVSPSMENMARVRGFVPPGSFDRFTRALLRSRQFRLAFRSGEAYVFHVSEPVRG
jgi:hypothetical protein